MPQDTGKRLVSRFFVDNVDKDFLVPFNDFDIEEQQSRLIDSFKGRTGRNSDIQVGDEIQVKDTKDPQSSSTVGSPEKWANSGYNDFVSSYSTTLVAEKDLIITNVPVRVTGTGGFTVRIKDSEGNVLAENTKSSTAFPGFFNNSFSLSDYERAILEGEMFKIEVEPSGYTLTLDISDLSSTNEGGQITLASIKHPPQTIGVTLGEKIFEFQEVDIDFDTIFTGYITRVDEENGTWTVEAEEALKETVDTRVKQVFKDESPESILESLIEDNTTLTFNAPVSSGVTLTKYVIEGSIEEAIEDMTKALDWQLRSDSNREVWFEPKGRIGSGKVFVNQENCVVRNRATKESGFINTVELQAGRQNYLENESFTGDGSTTAFNLSEVPVGNIEVKVNGMEQQGAIAEDLQSGDDFFIEQEEAILNFDSAPSSGANIEITYNYEVPILVNATAPNAAIPPSDREVATSIKREWIKTFADAREYARSYVKNNSKLTGEVSLTAPYSKDVPTGYKATIDDNDRDFEVNLTAEKKTINQNGRIEYEFGEEKFNHREWRRQTARRIDELEQEKTTQQTLTQYRSFLPELNIDLELSITVKSRAINNSFILGHPENGVLNGTAVLGDQRGPKVTEVTTS